MCQDDLEILKYIKKNNFYNNYYGLYEAFAYIYEKRHEFQKANESYIEGLAKEEQVYKIDELKKLYKQFEARMKTRIEREISQSVFSIESINEYIEIELSKV